MVDLSGMTENRPCHFSTLRRQSEIRTIWCPVLASENPVDTMSGPNLLTQEADASISKDSSIQCVFTLPWAQASMCTMFIFNTNKSDTEEEEVLRMASVINL